MAALKRQPFCQDQFEKVKLCFSLKRKFGVFMAKVKVIFRKLRYQIYFGE